MKTIYRVYDIEGVVKGTFVFENDANEFALANKGYHVEALTF